MEKGTAIGIGVIAAVIAVVAIMALTPNEGNPLDPYTTYTYKVVVMSDKTLFSTDATLYVDGNEVDTVHLSAGQGAVYTLTKKVRNGEPATVNLKVISIGGTIGYTEDSATLTLLKNDIATVTLRA